ncbi:MAG: hypothetical protein JSW61_02820 [Candidatus Thorarchaeota archaeon]|nr:MAG: hypothetical protein JSW61_02820 [Candidatus Thorarchaeota archaeon]
MSVSPFFLYAILIMPGLLLWWVIQQSRQEDTPLTTVYTSSRRRDPDDQGIIMKCPNCELSYRYFMDAVDSVDGSARCQNCGERIQSKS